MPLTETQMPRRDGAGQRAGLKISVSSVTVAYNAVHLLPRQIERLLGQSRPLQEIIVVDNASSDGTGALLAKRYPQVRVIPMAENFGAGGALAAGLAYAALGEAPRLGLDVG